jgi:uncharacterized protein (TIGR02453 family)
VLKATDEGHGFFKRDNSDYQFCATILYYPRVPAEINLPGESGSAQPRWPFLSGILESMTPKFPGFSPAALRFLKGLERNNRRDWFQPRKPEFEQLIKAPMYDLIEAVNTELAEFAPAHVTPPQRAMLRIYRDTRFSKDKRPYKTYVSAAFRLSQKKNTTCATFYFHFSPKQLLIWGGIYTPPAEELLAIRMLLAERHEEFRRLMSNRTLRRLMGKMDGEQLTRVPKGFSADHPAADLLKYKWIGMEHVLPPAAVTSPRMMGEIAGRFRALAPMVEFLNQPFHLKPRKTLPFMAF